MLELPQTKLKLIVLGHSHTNCIVESLRSDFTDVIDYRSLQLKTMEKRIRLKHKAISPQERDDLVLASLARVIGKLGLRTGRLSPSRIPGFVKSRGIVTVLCLRGAQHIIKGLVQSEPPCDFVLEAEEDLPIDEDVVLVPYGAIYEQYRRVLSGTLEQITHFKQIIRHNVYHIEVPPPYGDNSYIHSQLGGFFDKAFPEGIKIALPLFRYKLWRVCCRIYQEHCNTIGVTYIPVPRQTLVEGHFLHSNGYYRDAVHGNRWYGRQVIDGLLARIGNESVRGGPGEIP